jgi:rubrerythrin
VGKEQQLEALALAIETEKKGHKFYQQAEERVHSPLAKSVFAALAEEEFEHIKIIERSHSTLEEKGEWVSLEEVRKSAPTSVKVKTVFETAAEEMEERVKLEATDTEAYKAAMELENEAVSLYSRLHGEVTEQKARQLYEFMVQLETEHWNLLADTLLYLDNPRGWFFAHERPIIEG